jgi:inosine-uridine nucleoside N-ribohydrolase
MKHAVLRRCVQFAAVLVCALPLLAQAAGAPRKLIIDQDAFGPAGSNMQAILMLLQAPDVQVLGIVASSGDGFAPENASHVLRLLEVAKRTEVPVYVGAVYPLVNSETRTRVWEELYGKLYYKGAWNVVYPDQGASRRTPYHQDPFEIPLSPAGMPKGKPQAQSGVEFMIEQVRKYPGEVTIWEGGPMTTLALAVRVDPSFAKNAKELVFMGGSFQPQAADNHFANEYVNAPRREFNMRWDPEAASIVLREPWKKITQVPVDPTTKTFFKKEFFQEIAAGKAPFKDYLVQWGQSFPMWDELAAAIWLDPSLVTVQKRVLEDVDISFTAAYGSTLSWAPGEGPGHGERAVDVVFDIDVPRFERFSLELLTAPPAQH